MPLPPQPEKELNGTNSTPNAAVVREQLRRLLAHQLFTNSKRYPVLLAYIVEQALDGKASVLKERTIGVEAFGREPDYDVNVDPMVRATAAEVRKKLIQYYYNPEHAGELVIELPVGSYVPYFREPATPHTGLALEQVCAQTIEASPRDLVSSRASLDDAKDEEAPSGFAVRHWISIAIALLIGALVGFGVGRVKSPNQPSNLERFWEPITSISSRVTYCLGEPAQFIARETPAQEHTRPSGDLDVSDVTTLARSIFPLVPRNRAFRVVAASDIGFAQLREGPFVLIGAYDNIWTMRITQDLPFGFEYRSIVDRKSTQRRVWTIQSPSPDAKLERDYAIVARIHDKVTGQPAIILAGILRAGTEAAGEMVSNPVYLDTLLQKAPKNWEQLNLEAVIQTQVIEGHPGPPTVTALETW